MKPIGLIGGMTPESTKDYYSSLMDLSKERLEGNLNNPVVIIYSLNLEELINTFKEGEPDKAVEMLVTILDKLQGAGAEVGAMTANTVHVFFDEVAKRTTLPLISIVETTFDRAKELNCRRSLLLGTATTMNSSMYPNRFAKGGMEVVVPNKEDSNFIDCSIEEELSIGVFSPQTKERYIEICKGYIDKDGVDSVILGCTEIPLILQDGDVEVDLINTTKAHVRAIFDTAARE